MTPLSKKQISEYGKTIRALLKQLDRSASRCLFVDPLIRGTPQEVLRRCGKPRCACMTDDTKRHGPYKVISVFRDGKQRQVPLRKDQHHLWQLAEHYQYQVKQLRLCKQTAARLLNLMAEVIEKRLRKFPK